MFCLPWAGAGGSVYSSWRAHAPSGLDIVGVTPPGRLHRVTERPFLCVDDYVESLAQSIEEDQPGPYAVFGHSLGALIAYEVCVLLEERGVSAPAVLMLSAAGTPSAEDRARAAALRKMPDDQLASVLRERYHGPKFELPSEELWQLVLEAFRDDLRLLESYSSRNRPVRSPMAVFSWRGDAVVNPASLSGWRSRARGEFDLICLEGGHLHLAEDGRPVIAYAHSKIGANLAT